MTGKIFNIQRFSLHDGPGIRTSIFFSKCNLKCKWCANPECNMESLTIGGTKEYDAQTLLAEVIKDKAFYDKSGGGVTLTGGEIFMQYDFIKEFCLLLKENNIHITIETAGAIEPHKFQEIAVLADFIYIDCKHYDAALHKEGTGITNNGILANIGWLAASSKKYCVRIPVIPGFNDALSDAEGFCKLFGHLGIENIELLPFHQFGESKYEKAALPYAYKGISQLHKEDLAKYHQIFIEKGLQAALN